MDTLVRKTCVISHVSRRFLEKIGRISTTLKLTWILSNQRINQFFGRCRCLFVMVIAQRQGDLLQVIGALGTAGRISIPVGTDDFADWTAGSKSAIKTAMMAMTTSSSISVNARLRHLAEEQGVAGAIGDTFLTSTV
jgi:hypothetical protein